MQTMTNDDATTTALSRRQKCTYIVGVQLVAWIIAFAAMVMFYRLSYIWWWPCSFSVLVFAMLVCQFMPETIEGKTQWSEIDWKLLFSGAAKYAVGWGVSPIIWFNILKVQECADLRGPMQWFCAQEGGKESSAYFSPDHDGNTDQIAWIVFVPMLLVKMVVYETLFDLGYYWMHRSWHAVPWLYHIVHKHHHTLTDPQKTNRDPLLKSWHTFHMTIWEILSTLGLHIPCTIFLNICVFGSHPLLRITGLDMVLIYGYILVGEINGHVDSAFAFCHPIPASLIVNGVLGLTTITEKDHNLHHQITSCNFSKRLGVWDSLFGSMIYAEGGVGKWRTMVQ